MMQVSIIIPVFNDADRLRLCLDALAEQTVEEGSFEVLVVDNGSETPPRGLVDSYPFARFAEASKPGSFAARNRALPLARGNILAFTDADCIPKPDWLQKGVQRLERSSDKTFVSGRVEVFAADPRAPTGVELMHMAFGFTNAQHDQAVTANLIVRRHHFNAVGDFNEELLSGGDHEWSSRAVNQGLEFAYEPDAVVLHPARRSLQEGIIKRRRVVGGRVASRKERGARPGVFRVLLPDFAKLSAGRRRLRELGYGWLDRLRMAAVFTCLHYIGLIEAARNLLGKAAERR